VYLNTFIISLFFVLKHFHYLIILLVNLAVIVHSLS